MDEEGVEIGVDEVPKVFGVPKVFRVARVFEFPGVPDTATCGVELLFSNFLFLPGCSNSTTFSLMGKDFGFGLTFGLDFGFSMLAVLNFLVRLEDLGVCFVFLDI